MHEREGEVGGGGRERERERERGGEGGERELSARCSHYCLVPIGLQCGVPQSHRES